MSTRVGWLVTPDGERHALPDHILDEESILWPLTMPEVAPGQPVKFLDGSSNYRRHELIPGEAFLYLKENLNPHDITENEIAKLLGPALASKRPKRWDLALRDLTLISNGIADRTLEIRRHCVLVIPIGMWEDASDATRTIFPNMCKIHGITYRIENTGIGPAFWKCA